MHLLVWYMCSSRNSSDKSFLSEMGTKGLKLLLITHCRKMVTPIQYCIVRLGQIVELKLILRLFEVEERISWGSQCTSAIESSYTSCIKNYMPRTETTV